MKKKKSSFSTIKLFTTPKSRADPGQTSIYKYAL